MNSTIVDVKDFIDNRSMSMYQWLLLVLCVIVAALDGVDTAAMGFIAPSLMKDWHISRVAFGPVLSAVLFGFALGACLIGPLADRVGRRKILIFSVLLFGAFNSLCSLAQSPTQLIFLRLLAGIGLGAAMPTAATLLSEYAPTRLRSSLITVMFAGFALGSGLSGFMASYLLRTYSWRDVLLVSGLLPILSVPLLVWLLPESARFMAVQGRSPKDIARTLKRVCAARFGEDVLFTSPEPSFTAGRLPVQQLFRDGFGFPTIMLWISCFMGLLIVYLVTGWLPTLISDAGYSVQNAASMAAVFQVGSIPGALLIGFLMDRFDSSKVVSIAYVLGGTAIFTLGVNILNAAWLPAQVAFAGFFLGGAQTGLNALAPGMYPTRARATGVSWMNGVGRGGAILGYLIGGLLLSLGWHFGAVFAALAMPALIAATAILANRYAARVADSKALLQCQGQAAAIAAPSLKGK